MCAANGSADELAELSFPIAAVAVERSAQFVVLNPYERRLDRGDYLPALAAMTEACGCPSRPALPMS